MKGLPVDLGSVALQQLAGPNVLAVGDSNLRVLGLQISTMNYHRSQFDAVRVFLLCEFMRSELEFAHFAQFAPRLLPMQKCPLKRCCTP